VRGRGDWGAHYSDGHRGWSLSSPLAYRGASGAAVQGAAPVGGTVTGVTPTRVTCQNETTTHSVVMRDGATSCNCEAAGLMVQPGDVILQTVEGAAD
jgi:hypothetical protein